METRLPAMLIDLYRQRALIRAFAARDFKTRYRSSVLGWAWSLLQPLATLLVFSAVFSIVFRVQAPALGNGSGETSFTAFLFTGIVTWNLFSSFVLLSMTQLKSNGELLRKVQFPAWAPVLGASVVQFIQVGLECVVLAGLLLWERNVGWTWLWAIPILVGTALFGQGIGLVLSIVNAKFGDVIYIVNVVLGALYFLTPVLYPMSLVEQHSELFARVVQANPMSWYVEAMHESLYTLSGPSPLVGLGLLAGGFAVFCLGLFIFNRTSEDIGELL